MKKLIYLVILLVMANSLVLSGCKGKVERPSETETETSEFDFEE